jgi:hypothetical protein
MPVIADEDISRNTPTHVRRTFARLGARVFYETS